MLLTGRAFIEAGTGARGLDGAADGHRRPASGRRQRAARPTRLVALITPVVKAAFTDFGFETAVASQQVFGGHGYIREWGMEQYVRDARIAQIYEGTNGVQAMDLVEPQARPRGRPARPPLLRADPDRPRRGAADRRRRRW